MTGPSGSGKSTLFRAIAGIWPFGEGEVAVPEGQHDAAAAAALHPHRHAARRRDLSRQGAPIATGDHGALDGSPSCRKSPTGWTGARLGQTLSLGEQQRLAVARALLPSPTGCSSTRRRPRSTSRPRPRSTRSSRRRCRRPPSCPSATARLCSLPSTGASTCSRGGRPLDPGGRPASRRSRLSRQRKWRRLASTGRRMSARMPLRRDGASDNETVAAFFLKSAYSTLEPQLAAWLLMIRVGP